MRKNSQTWDWGMVAEDDEGVAGFVACTGDHLDQLFVDPGPSEARNRNTAADAAMGKVDLRCGR